ncbi:Protein of unknown function [Pyronema omphalodes CBS 100304]|uniref:Uncharacterized protein n=1 Tax=Pyronema omphalodes (strain CBS 100304) TaxID=1076935 RepID=U4L939_PYROM|nr:Protein of unknown function [Pyronema omphalodes CBS 100304]
MGIDSFEIRLLLVSHFFLRRRALRRMVRDLGSWLEGWPSIEMVRLARAGPWRLVYFLIRC